MESGGVSTLPKPIAPHNTSLSPAHVPQAHHTQHNTSDDPSRQRPRSDQYGSIHIAATEQDPHGFDVLDRHGPFHARLDLQVRIVVLPHHHQDREELHAAADEQCRRERVGTGYPLPGGARKNVGRGEVRRQEPDCQMLGEGGEGAQEEVEGVLKEDGEGGDGRVGG